MLCGQNFVKAFAFNSGSRPLMAATRTARVLSSAATEEAAETAADSSSKPQAIPDMEEIVSLCKRRGIIFPSSEIYNGYAGFFDYGPLGAELKKNLKDVWWKHFVTQREDVVGLDSSIIHNPTVWKSSGTYRSVVVIGELFGFVCSLEWNGVGTRNNSSKQTKQINTANE